MWKYLGVTGHEVYNLLPNVSGKKTNRKSKCDKLSTIVNMGQRFSNFLISELLYTLKITKDPKGFGLHELYLSIFAIQEIETHF